MATTMTTTTTTSAAAIASSSIASSSGGAAMRQSSCSRSSTNSSNQIVHSQSGLPASGDVITRNNSDKKVGGGTRKLFDVAQKLTQLLPNSLLSATPGGRTSEAMGVLMSRASAMTSLSGGSFGGGGTAGGSSANDVIMMMSGTPKWRRKSSMLPQLDKECTRLLLILANSHFFYVQFDDETGIFNLNCRICHVLRAIRQKFSLTQSVKLDLIHRDGYFLFLTRRPPEDFVSAYLQPRDVYLLCKLEPDESWKCKERWMPYVESLDEFPLILERFEDEKFLDGDATSKQPKRDKRGRIITSKLIDGPPAPPSNY